MLRVVRVSVLLRQAKVDNVHYVCPLPDANDKIVGLDISVNKVTVVNEFQARYQLDSQHHGRLQGKPPPTIIEQILQARTQEIHHHNVVVAHTPLHVHAGYSHPPFEDTIHFCFIQQLRELGIDRFLLHCHRFPRAYALSNVDFSKSTVPYLPAQRVVPLELPCRQNIRHLIRYAFFSSRGESDRTICKSKTLNFEKID